MKRHSILKERKEPRRRTSLKGMDNATVRRFLSMSTPIQYSRSKVVYECKNGDHFVLSKEFLHELGVEF